MFNVHRIDKSTTINATGIVIKNIVCRSQTPGTRLQIKIVFNFRLVRNIKNTFFHDLDCTSGQDARITVGANGVDLTNKIDITKIVIKLSIKIT